MNNLKLINVLKEANARVSMVKSFVDKVADGAALAKANQPLFNAFTEVLNFARTDANQIRGVKAGTQNADNILKTVDELMYALKTPNGMKAETVGLLNQGLLKAKSTPINMVDDIAKDVVVQEKFISRYGQLTDKKMKEALLAAGYSDNAANSLIANAKKNPKFKAQMKLGVEKRRMKRNPNGGQTPMNPKGNGSNVLASQKKTLSERAKELLDMIRVKKMTWKQVVAWGAGIGITAFALWWWLYDNSDDIPSDTPETEPTDTGEWAECIQKLIKSGEGKISTTPGGLVRVIVKNEQYPDGLAFYTNGRVADLLTKKKGSWKCKDAQITMPGMKIGIQEQSSEIDIDTMTTFVDEAVDALDGYVALGNLYTLEGIVKTLQGKTFQGKNALQEFLSLYKEDEGGDDFVSDVNSVGVKTLGTKGIIVKRNILSILGGGDSSSTPPKTEDKVGLSGIEIIWDGEKSSEGDTPTPSPSPSPRFKDCNNKELPHEFGCRSNKIKELQICLGLPEKYQTGNFGPITKKALEDKGIDTSNGITQFVIDTACAKGGEKPKRDKIDPITTDRLKMSDLVMPKVDIKLPDIKPLEVSDEVFYNALKRNGNIVGLEGNTRIKYKGPDLNEVQLGKLDNVIIGMGYTRIKNLEELKPYGSKYVWKKIS
jgi:hypothetical protein